MIMTKTFPLSDASIKVEWLKTQWQLFASEPYHRNQEIDISLPLPLVIGCDDEIRPYLMLLAPVQPKPLDGFEIISTTVSSRHGIGSEQWSLVFTLPDWGLLRTFAEFCSAMIDRVNHIATAQDALKQVYLTVDQWQRLFKVARNNDRLIKLRTTISELVAAGIISYLTEHPIENVCENWTGPYQAPQDFTFTESKTAYEVKSSYPTTQKVVISSAEQLGDSYLKHLSLLNITLDSVPKSHPAAENLSTIIDTLRARSDTPSLVTECIETRLDILGLNPYSRFESESYFHIEKAQIFKVDQNFPRIMVNQISTDIMNPSYELRISDIQSFCTQTIYRPLEQDYE